MQFPDTLIQQMEEQCSFRATVERLAAASTEVDEYGDPQGPDGITFIVERASGQLLRAEFDDSYDGDDFPLFIPAGKIIEAGEDRKAGSWRDLEAVVRDSWDGMLAQ